MEFLRFLPFIAAGLAAVIGAFFYVRNRTRLRQWRPAVGRIIGSQAMYAGGSTRHAPRVQFSTQDGRAITFVSQYGELVPPVVASEVSILYDPKKPARAELKYYISSQHAPLVCAICAVVFSLGGLPFVLR